MDTGKGRGATGFLRSPGSLDRFVAPTFARPGGRAHRCNANSPSANPTVRSRNADPFPALRSTETKEKTHPLVEFRCSLPDRCERMGDNRACLCATTDHGQLAAMLARDVPRITAASLEKND